MPEAVIIDTDIGTDVDDCLALGLLLGSPELDPIGISCVYGDVELRARMVHRLLDLGGRSDVPVLMGARLPLLGRRPVYWAGHEGVGLLEGVPAPDSLSDEHAVDFLVRTVMARPGQVHLVAIGPLTNVALAFLREPRLPAALARLTIMGGAVRGLDQLDLPYAEHNILCDPESAHVVLRASAPTFLVPLDVTTRTSIRRADVDQLHAHGGDLQLAIARQVELYPRFAEHGSTFVHDPLALASLIWPDVLGWQTLHVDVELEGEFATGVTLCREPRSEDDSTIQVATSVDAAGFERRLVERLSAGSGARRP
jgi:purine nucleosidase